jgi:hypothetical protein
VDVLTATRQMLPMKSRTDAAIAVCYTHSPARASPLPWLSWLATCCGRGYPAHLTNVCVGDDGSVAVRAVSRMGERAVRIVSSHHCRRSTGSEPQRPWSIVHEGECVRDPGEGGSSLRVSKSGSSVCAKKLNLPPKKRGVHAAASCIAPSTALCALTATSDPLQWINPTRAP